MRCACLRIESCELWRLSVGVGGVCPEVCSEVFRALVMKISLGEVLFVRSLHGTAELLTDSRGMSWSESRPQPALQGGKMEAFP